MFEIVYLLLDKKCATANELAERLQVSKRTVLRDIDALAIAGIPVYTTQGRGGGIAMPDNFILDKAAVSEEEQDQILFALQSVASERQDGSTDVLARLSALFRKSGTNWIEVDFSRWGNAGPDKAMFETLKTAILKKQAVMAVYAGSGGETMRRTLYPLKLVFKSKAWYLQAFCLLRNEFRTFKISRILSLETLPDCFDELELTPPPLETVDAPLSLIHLTLRFAPHAAHRVYDEFAPEKTETNSDGSLTVRVDLPEDGWLYGFLLSYGAAVQVLEPEKVRLKLLEQIDGVKKLYAGNKT
jgi:predicted DNA-binding transcriptional regulator YafY